MDLPQQRSVLLDFLSKVAPSLNAASDTPALQRLTSLKIKVTRALAAISDNNCSAALDYSIISSSPLPWQTPNTSYCRWVGIQCCISGGSLVMKYCNDGPQSVAMITLPGSHLTGTIPNIFAALPDLQALMLHDNPGLVGILPSMPQSVATKMQMLDTRNTGISHYASCTDNGATPASPNECLPHWLWANVSEPDVPSGIAGMLCPSLDFQRAEYRRTAWTEVLRKYEPALEAEVDDFLKLRDKRVAIFQPLQYIHTDPTLYGYLGCSCLAGYDAIVSTPTPGTRKLTCVSNSRKTILTAAIAVSATIGGVLLLLVAAFLVFHKQIMTSIEQMRINRIKRRVKPGFLTDSQRQCMNLGKEVIICLTDIAGSTALWEWNAHLMEEAIQIHDTVLRRVMQDHFGHEVYTEGDSFIGAYHDPADAVAFAVNLQLAMLQADWPLGISEHPSSAEVAPQQQQGHPSDNTHVFRGLRVRAVVHSGIPSAIEKHTTTSQLTYQGTFVELAEAFSILPAGGQTLVSNQTLQLVSRQSEKTPKPVKEQAHQASGWWQLFLKPMKRRATVSGLPIGATTSLDAPQASPDSESWRVNSAAQLLASSLSNHATQTPEAKPLQSLTATPGSRSCSSQELPAAAKNPPRHKESSSHKSTLLLDMGEFRFQEFPELKLHGQPGSAALKGVNLMQILPEPLAERAGLFPLLPSMHQVSPSFFDSPASGMATFMRATRDSALPAELVTVVFCTLAKSLATSHLMELSAAEKGMMLNRFRSCVRTTLLLLGGVECQEKEGCFMLAFSTPRLAAEWAMSLQLCLFKLPAMVQAPLNSSKLMPVPAAAAAVHDRLLAKIGMAEGPMTKVCPHKATGRIDYFGQCVNRAARLQAAAFAGETVMDHHIMDQIMQDCAAHHAPSAAHNILANQNYRWLAQGHAAQDAVHVDDRLEGSRASSLEQAADLVRDVIRSQAKPAASTPTTEVAVEARFKGTYALKGITGLPLLSLLIPAEISAALQTLDPRFRYAQRSQRGKATKMIPAPATSQPQIRNMPLLDIFGLPMLPDEPCQAYPKQWQDESVMQLAFDVHAEAPAHGLPVGHCA
ncbi:hypothetical protein WJX74_006588 [Apatococcus lobatus]|uniref:Guanylate cyclase domain-containing protein n=2 Tax=Apatococcus TaxID=904362 RepID=A0AAW1T079_9CHLO